MKKLLLVLLACIVIGGCTQRTPYRTRLFKDQLCVEESSEECPEQDGFFLLDDPEVSYDIPVGIIEFDDQGVLQDRELKDEIMDQIRPLTREDGTLVFVFAHGWLNDASPGNQNLARFQQQLKTLAKADQRICKGRSCAGRKVVGVYLAWRGKSAKTQPFKGMSFWNRKSRAHRVGQDGATEVFAELRKMKAGGPRKSLLIIVGHSFGGALVYSATQQLLMKDAASQNEPKPPQNKPRSVPRTVADLVILVNPAFEAARLTSLFERADWMEFPKTQSPVLAIFTSESDGATKKAFPAGRRLSSLFTKYNPNRAGQKRLDRTAIGHYPGYQTHKLCLKPEDQRGKSAEQLNDKQILQQRVNAVCEWERFAKENDTNAWVLPSVVLARESTDRRMTPYYNVVVDDAIISGHSGIWKPRFFMEFIDHFVRIQDAKDCEKAQKAYGLEWNPQPLPAAAGWECSLPDP